MKRRDILKYGASLSLLGASASWVWAQGKMNHGSMPMDHNMEMGNMAKMDHGKMGGMMADKGLLPILAMQSGLPLAALALLPNISTQKGVFEANLTAQKTTAALIKDNEATEIWAYNGQLPGPQIVVTEGDTVKIHFTNQLDQPTTVHWHGLPIPSDQDGNPHDPVLPGQTHTYQFTLPDGCAGTYWYHPHPHGHVSEQVYMGLAGTLIVKAKDDVLAKLPEQHWLISDLRLNKQAQIPANTMADWMDGREGQFVLINGQLQPKIALQGNERIRIWNATSARYMRLQIPGVVWEVVGTDGGLLETARPLQNELFLAPAERVEVVLRIHSKQKQYVLQSAYYDRDKMMGNDSKETLHLANIALGSKKAVLPQTLRTLPARAKATAHKQVIFSEAAMNHGQMGMGNMQNMFLVNGKSYDMNRIDLVSKVGEEELWEIINNSHMDHPFHLHGTQFEVLSRTLNNKTERLNYRALKDTINLKPKERVFIQTKQDTKGLRMFHCHILEHENLGMMANLNVV